MTLKTSRLLIKFLPKDPPADENDALNEDVDPNDEEDPKLEPPRPRADFTANGEAGPTNAANGFEVVVVVCCGFVLKLGVDGMERGKGVGADVIPNAG